MKIYIGQDQKLQANRQGQWLGRLTQELDPSKLEANTQSQWLDAGWQCQWPETIRQVG